MSCTCAPAPGNADALRRLPEATDKWRGEESYVTRYSPRNAKPSSFLTRRLCVRHVWRIAKTARTCWRNRRKEICAHFRRDANTTKWNETEFTLQASCNGSLLLLSPKQHLAGQRLSPLSSGVNFIRFSQHSCLTFPVSNETEGRISWPVVPVLKWDRSFDNPVHKGTSQSTSSSS